MSPVLRDRITGAVLLATALVWTGLVYSTIPVGQGVPVGPRAFPLIFGIALALLSLAMLAQTLAVRDRAHSKPKRHAYTWRQEAWCLLATIGLTACYASVLPKLGFLPATTAFIALVLMLLLRITKPLLLLGMSVGISVGSYVLFAKLLGTYLPPGTWITFYI
jgi:hypothetical protein